jgi:hypothetical protein
MKLRNLKPKLGTMSSFEEALYISVLHCGGNDLGQHSIGDLRELAKSQLQYAATLFPTTKIIWSQIPSFAHSCEHDNFNSEYLAYPPPSLTASVAAALFNLIRTRSIALRFSEYLQLLLGSIWDQIIFVVGNKVAAKDGTHLSPLAKEVFLNTIQGALETFKLSDAKVYPKLTS